MTFRYSKLMKLYSNHKSYFLEVNWISARKTEKKKGQTDKQRFKWEAFHYSDPREGGTQTREPNSLLIYNVF